jgi:hypothetical protein
MSAVPAKTVGWVEVRVPSASTAPGLDLPADRTGKHADLRHELVAQAVYGH